MNIDWKARLKNKTWWVTIVTTLILLGKQFGFDLTQWIPSNYADIVNTIFILLALVGITVDTSTEGISDYIE